MKKLPKPSLTARKAYETCLESVKLLTLKRKLESATDEIVRLSNRFDEAAKIQQLHTLVPHTMVGPYVTTKDMKNVYKYRMLEKKSTGRAIYDSILANVPHRRCPLCYQREASTIDHHLSKSDFPGLAVAPLNLVPACWECNTTKLTYLPTCSEEETFHPYYDDFENELWLFADVVECNPAGLRFRVEVSEKLGDLQAKRILNHFKLFELDKLYSSNAGNELSNIKHQVSGIFNRGGANEVAEFLAESAESREKASLNSWQAAMYRSLARNAWYCHGGFR